MTPSTLNAWKARVELPATQGRRASVTSLFLELGFPWPSWRLCRARQLSSMHIKVCDHHEWSPRRHQRNFTASGRRETPHDPSPSSNVTVVLIRGELSTSGGSIDTLLGGKSKQVVGRKANAPENLRRRDDIKPRSPGSHFRRLVSSTPK